MSASCLSATDAALALREDLRRQLAAPEVVPEPLELRHALVALAQPLALRVGDFLRLAQAFVRDLEPLVAVLLEFLELLLALAVLLLALEVGGECLELLAAGAPQRLQAEVHQRVVTALRVAQQHFELLELLLQARIRVFLLLQLVAQVVQLVVERLQLLLELGAVPEELEQALLFQRIGLADRRQLQLRPLVGKDDGHRRSRIRPRGREPVSGADAVLQPLVQQHVAGPAPVDSRAACRRTGFRNCGWAGSTDVARASARRAS